MLEMLGAERLVYGQLDGAAEGQMFVLRIEGTAPPPAIGSHVAMHVEPENLHWFDATTGQRVNAG
jgi:sn-glycerol 3-phosphate transport system ATP-binding protein